SARCQMDRFPGQLVFPDYRIDLTGEQFPQLMIRLELFVKFGFRNPAVDQRACGQPEHQAFTRRMTMKAMSSKSSIPLTALSNAVVPPAENKLSRSLSSFTWMMERMASWSKPEYMSIFLPSFVARLKSRHASITGLD